MARHFFVGESAIDSVLQIATNVDQQLLDAAKLRGCLSDHYQPWMAIPPELLTLDQEPAWSRGSLFFGERELQGFSHMIGKLSPGQDTIFSMENYPIKISCINSIENERFRSNIMEAKAALEDLLSWTKPIYENIVHKIVPIEGLFEEDESDYGMSTIWLKGVIFYDKRQHQPFEFRVENMAHELAHQVIINYQLSDRLIEGDLNAPVYSGIRKTNRPAIMAFHGAAALTYMLLTAKALKLSSRVKVIRSELNDTLKSLRTTQLTPLGKTLTEEMYESID